MRDVRRRRMRAAGIALAAAILTTFVPDLSAPTLAKAGAVPQTSPARCDRDLAVLRESARRPGPPGARAGYRLASCLQQTGRLTDAQMTFDAVAERYPPLASYARFQAAELTLRSGAAREAAGRLAGLLRENLSAPLARRVRVAYAQALLESGSAAQAATILREVVRAISDDETARAWWLLGRAAEATSDRAQARRAYAMAWWGFPDSPSAEDAAGRLRALSGGALPDPPPEARVERATHLLRVGEWAAAERELVRAIHAGLSAADAGATWYQLGQLRLRPRSASDDGSESAAYAFAQAARDPAQSARALYWLGRVFVRAGRGDDAQAIWNQVAQRYPAGEWAARSMLRLASLAEGAKAWHAAEDLLVQVVRRFPGSEFEAEASWRRGWIAYRREGFAQAEAIWVRAVEAHPVSSRAAGDLYWAAKARERQGKSGKALLARIAQRYPLAYYGQRARGRLRRGVPAAVVPAGSGPLPPNRFAARHVELGALGFDREAADEAEALLPPEPAKPAADLLRFIARHRSRAGEIPASVAAAEEVVSAALSGGAPADAELWMLAYPRAYWDQARSAAAAAGVDPYLLLAVMREESRFDARAVSPAGAVGLMQLMSGTARTLAGGRDVPARGLMEPNVNLRYGAAYLGQMFRRFGRDVVLTLAAYNAGPGAARRFARRPRSDPDLFIETLPIFETRAYVLRVRETYGVYRWLYR